MLDRTPCQRNANCQGLELGLPAQSTGYISARKAEPHERKAYEVNL
ncbi:MAG TPA: hypothetical protein VJ001_16820 [Rhodocyclaceae bacterium]|nr:hypothetical protein [Rhodocyclaceae bacterium]